jgi:putative phosphoesterase
MKFGLISDSHDHMENTRRAISLFQHHGVEMVIHAGDIVSPPLVKLFDNTSMKLAGVFGNNDGEKLGLAKFFEEVGGVLHGDFADIEEDGIHIAVYHGTSRPLLESIVVSELYDLVVTGHTHVASVVKRGRTLVVNPGSAHGFGHKASVVVFNGADMSTELLEIQA